MRLADKVRSVAASSRSPAAVLLLGLALLAACGDGGSPALQVTVEPGKVTCEPLRLFEAYNFHSIHTLELEERGPSLPETDPYGPAAFAITFDVDGAVQGSDRVQALISYPEDNTPTLQVVAIGDTFWLQVAGQWTAQEGVHPAVYEPLSLCSSLAPDIDLSGLTGQPETVGKVATHRYRFDALPSEFAKRSQYFGGQSDSGRLIEEYDVDVWVADEGGYIARLDLTGTGEYENGRKLTIRLFYELSDVDSGSIEIVPPDV